MTLTIEQRAEIDAYVTELVQAHPPVPGELRERLQRLLSELTCVSEQPEA